MPCSAAWWARRRRQRQANSFSLFSVSRQGGQRFVGIPQANGYIDYLTLLNARDGGINGVKLAWEDCDTVYDVDRSVECYERLKAKGPTGAAVFHPPGTHVVYALTERATHDKIPLLTVGFRRADASDGRVFPYIFPAPINYWSQNTARSGSLPNGLAAWTELKGLKIVHVYHESDYGRETIPVLDAQAAQYGFAVQHLPVQPPGLGPERDLAAGEGRPA